MSRKRPRSDVNILAEPEVWGYDKQIEEMSKQEDYTPASATITSAKTMSTSCEKNCQDHPDKSKRLCKLISAKFKKTYKNRYYIFSKSN